MRIAATGFVSDSSGSIASANAVFLRELLRLGHSVSFFSKPTFVDPREAIAACDRSENLEHVDCTNLWGDRFRRVIESFHSGIFLRASEKIDSASYNRGVVRAMQDFTLADIDLWLGDWARGRSDRPVVSFVQGAPGSDARSVFNHRGLIERLAGKTTFLKLAAYAQWRLMLGLPDFRLSDRVIAGSTWSCELLSKNYAFERQYVYALPYPIDLEIFRPAARLRSPSERLRLFWLGRFVPRKRLDLFLNGMAVAIRSGCDVEAWVIGKSGFVPNYERLLEEFPYPDRLLHRSSIPRAEVPGIFSEVDVMSQPSDDEDFGSSVAEALACGVPAIVGCTNGTSDYICGNSIKLKGDDPEEFAEAILMMATAKKEGKLVDRSISRNTALRHFNIEKLGIRLEQILLDAANSV